MPVAAQPLLECIAVRKRFGGVTALDGVDLALHAGEVHGLVGSNGAGKSTLMKVLAGALPDHEGIVLLDGQPVQLTSPQVALRCGVAMVYQELSGVGQLSVAENVFLGRQPTGRFGRIDWRAMRREARGHLQELGIDIDVTRRLDRFPLVVRQMVEIARGVHSGARLLILDEPTSALSPAETRRLFDLIDRLRDRGMAVVFISHFIEDVLAISDRVTILRNGRRLETTAKARLDKHYVIDTMLGYEVAAAAEDDAATVTLGPPSPAAPVLVACDLDLPGALRRVSLAVSPGECLGLYGLVGAGHEELLHVLAGSRKPAAGAVFVDGQLLRPGNCHDAVRRGVALVTADRRQGLHMQSEVYKNVTLAHLRRVAGRWVTSRKEIAATQPILDRVGCRPPDGWMRTGNLSGGNQQKVVVAKWLLGPLKVLLLDEPTRGMDVGAKREVMRLVGELKRQGLAVVLASCEPEVLLAHADRILVMRQGRIARQFADTQVTKARLMQHAALEVTCP